MRAVVTGANRGLGLAFVQALLARGDRVIATCRDPESASELQALARTHGDQLAIHALDVGDAAAIARFPAVLDGPLELLINNAGVVDHSGAQPTAGELEQCLRVNSLGPLLLGHALAPHLAGGERPLVACLTSRVGALREGKRSAPGGYGYAMSKAALHRAIPQLAANLADHGIAVVGLDPGWVATGMTAGATGDRYQLDPAESVAGMLQVIDRFDPAASGTLLRWNGQPCRWYGPPESDEELQRR